MVETRDIRQKGIIDPEKLAKLSATVIGCGAIGRNVVIELGKMGMPKIQVIDHDKVEIANLAPQGFYAGDIGQFKVGATKKLIETINPDVKIDTIQGKFDLEVKANDIVFCCVDDMDARKFIFERLHKHSQLWMDARMAAETFEIYSVFNEDSAKFYETSLFPQSEAYAGSCTTKSTNYCACIAASFMITQFSKWLREINPEFKVNFNLLSMEIDIKN